MTIFDLRYYIVTWDEFKDLWTRPVENGTALNVGMKGEVLPTFTIKPVTNNGFSVGSIADTYYLRHEDIVQFLQGFAAAHAVTKMRENSVG